MVSPVAGINREKGKLSKLVFKLKFDYSRPLSNTLLSHIMLNVNHSNSCLVTGDLDEQPLAPGSS